MPTKIIEKMANNAINGAVKTQRREDISQNRHYKVHLPR